LYLTSGLRGLDEVDVWTGCERVTVDDDDTPFPSANIRKLQSWSAAHVSGEQWICIRTSSTFILLHDCYAWTYCKWIQECYQGTSQGNEGFGVKFRFSSINHYQMEQTALIKEHCAAHSLQQEGRGRVLSRLLEIEQRGILGRERRRSWHEALRMIHEKERKCKSVAVLPCGSAERQGQTTMICCPMGLKNCSD
jgi:hypothetical protein